MGRDCSFRMSELLTVLSFLCPICLWRCLSLPLSLGSPPVLVEKILREQPDVGCLYLVIQPRHPANAEQRLVKQVCLYM